MTNLRQVYPVDIDSVVPGHVECRASDSAPDVQHFVPLVFEHIVQVILTELFSRSFATNTHVVNTKNLLVAEDTVLRVLHTEISRFIWGALPLRGVKEAAPFFLEQEN